MRNASFQTRVTLGLLLACGFCLPRQDAWADIKITQIELDGQPKPISAEAYSGSKPLSIHSNIHSVRFHFTEADGNGQPTTRLRYKLEGYDSAWRDLPIKMRAVVYFQDQTHQIVGSSDFSMTGETPGWRGSPEKSDFIPCREQATAPERSASAMISFLSHGGDSCIGLIGIDAVRVLVEHPGNAQPQKFDLSVTKGTDLSHPLGSPENWTRAGSRAELAELRTRPVPTPHPILVLNDDDPFHYGNWAMSHNQVIPVAPGDRLTLEWQCAYSIGSSGPGEAEYPQLKAGSYFFRVAATRANGEPTGLELSLPILVTIPLYHRWEFWLVIVALASAAAAWAGRLTVQRRMQRRLAELERQQAMERERERIARDLHDNIGAGLTEIAMQSDWVHNDLEQGVTAETQQRVERIRQSATDLARSVDEIVWAVNPANDTLKRFANYLTQCAAQFLDAADLRVRFDIPQELPPRALSGKLRHCLFLAVREALNNAVKHARADLVRLELRVEENGLRIVVEDNGAGFDPGQTVNANTQDGLENMRRRMEEIGGKFQLTSQPGKGTRIELFAPLAPDNSTTTRSEE